MSDELRDAKREREGSSGSSKVRECRGLEYADADVRERGDDLIDQCGSLVALL